MIDKRKLILGLLIGSVVVAFAMAFFVRPHPSTIEMITATEELPDPDQNYPLDLGLADRVNKSYGLALVLTISEYSRKNALALESLRSWAKQEYQTNPGFLHAVPVEELGVQHQSIVDSFLFNLMASPRYACEESTLAFLRDQIGRFHKSKAFQRFRADYFESFGLDREAALLLARYESDKARLAANVLIATGFWLAVFAAGLSLALKAPKPNERSSKGQRLLAFFWLILAAFYLSLAWFENEVPMLISAWICLWAGIYIRRPVVVRYGEDKGLTLALLSVSQSTIAIATWATFSLVAIQMMTWLKMGTLNDPDPIMLIISSLTGNFLHDPASAKHAIGRAVGVVWLLVGVWAFLQVTTGEDAAQVEHELASLKDTLE